MPVTAHLTPHTVCDGGSLHIEVAGLETLAGETATVELAAETNVDAFSAASIPGTVSAAGLLEADWTGVSLGREAATFVVGIRYGGPTTQRTLLNVDASTTAIVNPTTPLAGASESETRRQALEAARQSLYQAALGDQARPGALEHRTLIGVEELLVTSDLYVPGVSMHPVTSRPDSADQRQIIDDLLAALDWPSSVDAAWWTQMTQSRRPWTAIVFPKIWAVDLDAAALAAREVRDDLLAILGLNRGARGRPIATVIEQRQPDDTVRHRIYLEGRSYTGNLLAGQLSGESQTGLLTEYLAISADPLLRLLVDLYSEALAERSEDAQYFRFWTILETLSGARIPHGQPVTLLDGTAWPGTVTTTRAAPRVYKYLVERLVIAGQIAEQSVGGPAASLYEAVRAWYGRRNATGHYGRFTPTAPVQQRQGWFTWASKTLAQQTNGFGWLRSLQETVAMVLHSELNQTGIGLLP